jgi:hypothetical protein
VSKVTPAGVVTDYAGTGLTPIQITFDGTHLWTANAGSNGVSKITLAGVITNYVGTGEYPYDIASDGSNVWTANQNENSVTKVTSTGVMTTYATGSGGGIVTNYAIERSINNGSSFSPLITVGNVTTYTDATGPGNPQVMYRVYAIGPGGNSATSANSNNIAPVFNDVFINNIDSTNGPLLLDGSYAYAISSDSGGVKIVITKIDLSNSGLRTQNLAVYTPTGTFVYPFSAIYFSGFIYLLVKDQGESNGRILKIDPTTLTVTLSLALTTGAIFPSGTGVLVTDGTDCWAVSGLSGASKVTHFNPTTMVAITTGPSLGANLLFYTATAFGGDIYVGYRNSSTATSFAARISTSTLTVVEAAASNASFPSYVVNDGTSIYVKGTNAGSARARVEKFTVGPLAFSAQTADLGFNTYGNMIYDSGSNALYMQQANNSITAGFQKVSTAPAFVSFIANTHFGSGTFDGARTDGTYVYFSNSNGYVARKLISGF